MQNELTQAFQEIDEQISQNVKLKLRQIEERQRKGTDRGRTDTFACDTCSGRIRFLINSDTTHCRENGCNGTLHRVYTDRTYSSKQRREDMDELERSTITMNRKMSFSIYLHRSFHPKQVTPTEVLQRFPVVSVFWNNI